MKKVTLDLSPEKSKGEITDRIKTFEDACAELGITGTVINLEMCDELEEELEGTIAHLKLVIIAKALNEGWKPDWNNSNEYKYYPYFELKNGFSLDGALYVCTSSDVSSRLCFKSEVLAKYAAAHFKDLYETYFKYNNSK